MEKRRTKIDLAFPSVVINPNVLKDRRRRRKWNNYRFYAVLVALLLFLFHFIDRTMLRLPAAETRLDWSNVKQIKDLSVDVIDSWCLAGDEQHDDDTCACNNPLIPEGRQEDERWEKVHHQNRRNFDTMQDVDVIFLGDSITEGWSGNFYNTPDPRVQGALPVFQSLFSKSHGGKYQGLAQGISADTTSNLLWRIQNGEIGSGGTNSIDESPATESNPLIFWVLIGTNDLGNSGCSADMILLGIIRIVEELRVRQPSAWVVINGVLPRTSDHSGFLMQAKGKHAPVYWPVIQTINAELQRYAAKRDKVEYFETQAFFRNATAPDLQLRLERELMNDFLHPSSEGYKRWGAEIVAKLDSLQSVLTTANNNGPATISPGGDSGP